MPSGELAEIEAISVLVPKHSFDFSKAGGRLHVQMSWVQVAASQRVVQEGDIGYFLHSYISNEIRAA